MAKPLPAIRHPQHFLVNVLVILVALTILEASEAIASQDLRSTNKVQRWLEELGVEQIVKDNFRAEKIDVIALSLLKREALSALGVTALGDQVKLLANAKHEQERLNEVQKRHGVASIRTNTYGDSTNKGGIQF